MCGAIASFNVNLSSSHVRGLSYISIENIEVLAIGESGSGYYVNPCGSHPGTECSSRTSPYPCSTQTYC